MIESLIGATSRIAKRSMEYLETLTNNSSDDDFQPVTIPVIRKRRSMSDFYSMYYNKSQKALRNKNR